MFAIRNSSLTGDVGRNILRLDGIEFHANMGGDNGGAIYTNADTLEISYAGFYENQAGMDGGAIYLGGEGGLAATIDNSQFGMNSARSGGGIYNGRGDSGSETAAGGEVRRFNSRGNPGLLIWDSRFYGNFAQRDGGAIYNGEEVLISDSLFEENQAVTEGGAIKNWPSGIIDIVNSTFSKNKAPESPAIFNFGQAYISYTTITESDGSGALSSWYATIEVSNLIVANNAGEDCDFRYPIRVLGVNLDSDGTCIGFDLMLDPVLGALQDNGGPTHTYALLAGSPAIDAAAGFCPDADQRGELRPLGVACDLGAYETSAPAVLAAPEVGEIPANPDLITLIVERDFPCYTGPGPQYNTLNTLEQGTEMEIVGYSSGGGWLVAKHPTLQTKHCWLDEDFISFGIPVSQLRLITIPAEPTATPTSTREPRGPAATVCVQQPNGPPCN